MLGLKTIFIVAYFGVFCMGAERPGWPGYEYEADIEGWLKVHTEPADLTTARATCLSEGALLASPWSAVFTSTITRIQASMSIPVMHSGAELKSDSASPLEIFGDKKHILFLVIRQNMSLPYACYAPGPISGKGFERPGWPGYAYEADIEGWLKVHTEPADLTTAKATCHSEGALLASPWSEAFTSTITRIQASMSIPVMHSGAGLKSDFAGTSKEIIENEQKILFLAVGQNTSLPYACFAPAPNCGKGYTFHSETGNCYKMHKEHKLMADAISTCLSEGGYLAKLDGGDTERQLLGKIVGDESITYIANDDGGYEYRHMFNSSGSQDYFCNEEHSFICEKPVANPGADLRD